MSATTRPRPGRLPGGRRSRRAGRGLPTGVPAFLGVRPSRRAGRQPPVRLDALVAVRARTSARRRRTATSRAAVARLLRERRPPVLRRAARRRHGGRPRRRCATALAALAASPGRSTWSARRTSCGRWRAGRVPVDRRLRMQAALLDHCDAPGDRFALLDALPARRPERVVLGAARRGCARRPTARSTTPGSRCRAGASGSCRRAATSPASTRACDQRVGVHKAPANEVLEGVARPRGRALDRPPSRRR